MSLLVLGGNSAIAKSIAEKFASDKTDIFFAGRNIAEQERIANDFRLRYGINTWSGSFDATDYGSHEQFLSDVLKVMPSVENVILAFGMLGEQQKAAADFDHARQIFQVNFMGSVSILTHLSNYLKEKRKGGIIVISSIAGDRGRQSNYIYGSAKGGLSIYCQGLRNELSKYNVNLMTVKPGFVDTPMTYGLELPKLLLSSPEKVGRIVYKSFRKKKDIVYAPSYWRYIMMIIRSIPEKFFKKLNL